MPDHLTETESLSLALAREQIASAQLRLQVAVQRIAIAHALGPDDQIMPDGSIQRAPPAAAPTPAPDPASPPATLAEETPE